MKCKKLLMILGILLISNTYLFGQSSIAYNVSSEISKTQLKNKLRKKGHDLDGNIRKQLIYMDSLNFISSCDTVFFLETYDYESGISYGMVWNKHKSITYQYLKNKVIFDRPFFDQKIVELVKTWDVDRLKMYGEKSTLISPLLISASRAIIKDRKINVDCIAFNQFYIP